VRFLARRVGVYAIALWGAMTLDYLIPRLGTVPGGPADPNFPDYVARYPGLATALGSGHGSIWAQYPEYLWQMAHGNIFLGIPQFGSDVWAAIPYSLALAVASTLLAFLLGTALGAISAWRRGGVFDSLIPTSAMALSSFPTYFVALGAVYLLALKWKLFPANYSHDPTRNASLSFWFAGNAVRHAELPILVLVVSYLGFWVLSMRNVMVNNLGDEYLLLAEAKGLKGRKVLRSYAARNALLVPLAMFAAVFSTSIDGIIVVERIFSYQGTGLLFQNAALANDAVIVQALLLLFTVSVLATNLLVDIVAVALDPRLR
jgi:peptide/nickel transport system permease protein